MIGRGLPSACLTQASRSHNQRGQAVHLTPLEYDQKHTATLYQNVDEVNRSLSDCTALHTNAPQTEVRGKPSVAALLPHGLLACFMNTRCRWHYFGHDPHHLSQSSLGYPISQGNPIGSQWSLTRNRACLPASPAFPNYLHNHKIGS